MGGSQRSRPPRNAQVQDKKGTKKVVNVNKSTERLHTGSQLVLSFALSCFGLASLGATPQAAPKTTEQLESLIYSVKGPDLFRVYCAVCHGSDAKGNGPLASGLKAKVPDLTVLAKTNGGQFP